MVVPCIDPAMQSLGCWVENLFGNDATLQLPVPASGLREVRRDDKHLLLLDQI